MPSHNDPVSLRLGIARLRLGSRLAARRMHALEKKAGKALGLPRRGPKRRWPYVAVLVACLAAATLAMTVTVLAKGAPMLRTLDNRLPSEEDVAVLDPYRRDETKLTPGGRYDRPVAAVQTGDAPALLRVRLEETLLTAAYDGDARVVAAKPQRDPGAEWTPRTVTQGEALEELKSGGFCKASDRWEAALGSKLPARRLPGGDNDGGRLLVFEKKTILADPDSPIPDDLVGVLLPEDIEKYGLGMVVYTYMGFRYINDAGTPAYQPLHVAVDSRAPRKPTQRPPAITGLAYDFYRWDVEQSGVRNFARDDDAPVDLQTDGLRPIAEWTKPEDAWFYDPADGWVYYGQALAPGVMTPLLLRSYAVRPESPLLRGETRYRLDVRAQSVPLDWDAIVLQWDSKATLGTLGRSTMTRQARDALFGRVYPKGAGVISYPPPKEEKTHE